MFCHEWAGNRKNLQKHWPSAKALKLHPNEIFQKATIEHFLFRRQGISVNQGLIKLRKKVEFLYAIVLGICLAAEITIYYLKLGDCFLNSIISLFLTHA